MENRRIPESIFNNRYTKEQRELNNGKQFMGFMIFCSGRILFLMFLLVWCIEETKGGEPKIFNVLKYGAVADGKTDNSQVIILPILLTKICILPH